MFNFFRQPEAPKAEEVLTTEQCDKRVKEIIQEIESLSDNSEANDIKIGELMTEFSRINEKTTNPSKNQQDLNMTTSKIWGL